MSDTVGKGPTHVGPEVGHGQDVLGHVRTIGWTGSDMVGQGVGCGWDEVGQEVGHG